MYKTIKFFRTKTNAVILNVYWEEDINMSKKENVSSGKISEKKWSPSAIDCFLINCDCKRCNLNKIYFKGYYFKCRMKETVQELIKCLGTPLIKY